MTNCSIRLAGITQESFVDGPGLRYVIFAQGCHHRCEGCHNQKSWDINAGTEFSVKDVIKSIKTQKKAIQGITFSGGEPFHQAGNLSRIARAAHDIGLDVVTYSGFTYEQLIDCAKEDEEVNNLLCASDLLIDGRYIQEKRSMKLQFRGSSNQRIIDIAQTQKNGQIVLWKN